MVKPKIRIRQRIKGIQRYTECEFTLNVDPDKLPTGNITVSWDGEIKVVSEDGNSIPISNVILRRRKERPTKKEDKVISQSFSNFHNFNVNKVFLDYESIYAIDSNTKLYNNKYITICIIAKATLVRTTEHTGSISVKLVNSMESVNDIKHNNMEPFMWTYAIDHIIQLEPSSCKIGIIVDSNLEQLEYYNNRVKPIYKDYYLPDNCTLLYASSDISDNSMNKILKYCDTTANQVFREKYANTT